MKKIVLVKLGGSIITNTRIANSPKLGEIDRLAKEIKRSSGGVALIIGHGAGSFGHIPAHKYKVTSGINGGRSMKGASITQEAALALNKLVVEALVRRGVNALSFPPSAGGVARNGKLKSWNVEPLRRALKLGFVPVTRGDVVIDEAKGVTIVSTEETFSYLASKFKISKIVIGADVDGVFTKNPKLFKDAKLFRRITRRNISTAMEGAKGSLKVDVTGGMASKLDYLYGISKKYGIICQIVNASVPGRIQAAVSNKETIGTIIKA